MSTQTEIAPVIAQIPNISAQEFFSKVPDGVWNLFSSLTDLDDYESLHHVIHKNKQCEVNWVNNLRQYSHHAKLLFDVFTSVKSLRFVFVRSIDVPRDWELHLFFKDHYGKDKHKSLTHDESFAKVCKDGHLDIVRAMVERTQVDLEARDDSDRTPLHIAALKGHLPVVQYLCEQGADKEARSDGGRTPLHLAAYHGRLPVVQYLCEQGADKDARDYFDMTPLLWAARFGHLLVVQYLCEQGADKEAKTEDGSTPLHKAALEGYLPVVRYLCEQGANKEARGQDGQTPLHAAAYDGHVPVVKYLYEQGADKGARTNADGFITPLHVAALNGHLPVVKYLCEQGADKEARSAIGMTPLHIARTVGLLPVVQYLEAVKQCGSCGKACTLECSLCHAVYYCNAECQKKAWKAHKKQCTGYKKKEKK